jgi:DNA-directed RNA polymerase subunit RPC12/RpoP
MNNIYGYHNCNVCNKKYKSYKSLWNHNKSFHNNIIANNNNDVSINKIAVDTLNDNKVNITTYNCIYCNKIFKSRQNKWEHQTKHCKQKIVLETTINKDNSELELEKIKLEKIKEEKEKLKEQNEMIRLKIKLQNCKNLDNKTFKAVNKFLMDRSFKNSNNNTNCNNTTNNNNIINNNIILSIGNEQLIDRLTSKEKRAILNERYCSLEKMVEIVHCGKHNKFKNVLITNLKDNYAYKYDEMLGYFITVTKTDLLNDVLARRITDIEEIYDELSLTKKIDDKTKELIQKMLDKIHNENTPYYDDDEETKYPNYKSYKINNIKILLYNNHYKMTRDIALLVDNDIKIPIDI